MNREQARAILANIELIRHFAEGGDIGHRLINCEGKLLYTTPTNKIVLGNLRPDGLTTYVRLKTKFRWNPVLQGHERVIRCWPTRVPENEILPCQSARSE